jgi:hypothetical protein
MNIDITGIPKGKVFATLYNHATVKSLHFLKITSKEITQEEADTLLEKQTYFDYINGRVIKMDFSTNSLDTRLYNRDNGPDAAEKVISALVESMDKDNAATKTNNQTSF